LKNPWKSRDKQEQKNNKNNKINGKEHNGSKIGFSILSDTKKKMIFPSKIIEEIICIHNESIMKIEMN